MKRLRIGPLDEAIESRQFVAAGLAPGRKEMDEHNLSALRRERHLPVGEIFKLKRGCCGLSDRIETDSRLLGAYDSCSNSQQAEGQRYRLYLKSCAPTRGSRPFEHASILSRASGRSKRYSVAV